MVVGSITAASQSPMEVLSSPDASVLFQLGRALPPATRCLFGQRSMGQIPRTTNDRSSNLLIVTSMLGVPDVEMKGQNERRGGREGHRAAGAEGRRARTVRGPTLSRPLGRGHVGQRMLSKAPPKEILMVLRLGLRRTKLQGNEGPVVFAKDTKGTMARQ